MKYTSNPENLGIPPGPVHTSLEKHEALMVGGIWHEVDGGVAGVIVCNAQVSSIPQRAQMDLPKENTAVCTTPEGGANGCGLAVISY